MNKIDERIDRAAREYACNSPRYKDDTRNSYEAFRAGAGFAISHQWRSVEEELPPDDEDVFVALVNGYFTFYGVGWCSCEANGTKRWRTNDNGLDLSLVKFWMPIPKIGE